MKDGQFNKTARVSVDRLIQVQKGESVRIKMEVSAVAIDEGELAHELDKLETVVRRQMKKHIEVHKRGSVQKRTPKPR